MNVDNLLTPEDESKMAVDNAGAMNASSTDPARPAGLPDKFWDGEKRIVRVDALVQSYLALEKKLSTMIALPGEGEDRSRIHRALGVPDTPDAYNVRCDHGLFTADADLNKRMHERGFTPDQVQMVYDLAAEKMVPMILEIAEEFKADREVDRLISAFGGPERWAEISRQLLAYGRKNLPADVLTNLSSSFEGVMALYRMMQGGESALDHPAGKDASGLAPDENALRSMMRDPKYWRDRDPSTIAQVTQGFQRIYGGAE